MATKFVKGDRIRVVSIDEYDEKYQNYILGVAGTIVDDDTSFDNYYRVHLDECEGSHFLYGGQLELLEPVQLELFPKDVKDVFKDDVSHPAHYTAGKVEVIDYIHQVCADYPGDEAANVANIIKYISRAPHKGTKLKDLEKALWYLNDLVNLVKEKQDDV